MSCGFFLGAATQEIRLSADHPIEGGIKERAATRFAEIVRTEARAVHYAAWDRWRPSVRPRRSSGCSGTVWGIMNSFIGISKAQTTLNLAGRRARHRRGIAGDGDSGLESRPPIPAVIIYNHFSRSTKSYLDLVSRALGAVGRLLSRDLDRFRSGTMSRAAE